MARHRLGVVLLAAAPRRQRNRRAAPRAWVSHRSNVCRPTSRWCRRSTCGEDEIDNAFALARRVAGEQPKRLHITIGPVATFHPITPVVYLSVNGADVGVIHRMRDEMDAGPLAQELRHEFVPHVTLSDDATEAEITGAMASLTHYVEAIALDGITVLEQDDEDKMWRPIADAPFGAGSTTRTLGADRFTFDRARARNPHGKDNRPLPLPRGGSRSSMGARSASHAAGSPWRRRVARRARRAR